MPRVGPVLLYPVQSLPILFIVGVNESTWRRLLALDAFGVDYIELTSPAASEQSRLDCIAICKLGLKASLVPPPLFLPLPSFAF